MRFLLLAICISVGFSSCTSSLDVEKGQLIDLIPSKSILIVESQNLSKSIEELTNTDLFQANASLPIFKTIQEKFKFSHYIKPESQTFLAITPIGERELATSLLVDKTNLQLDSIQLSKQKKIDYAGKVISEFDLENHVFFTTLIDDIRVLSESKLMIENVIRAYNNQFKFDNTFYRAHKATTGHTSLFINLDEVRLLYRSQFENLNLHTLKGLGAWIGLDVKVSKDSYRWSGAIISDEATKLDLFQNVSPAAFRTHEVTPTSASGFFSISYSDFKALQKNREKQNYTATSSFNLIFENTSQVAAIQLENGALVYDVVSHNVSKTLDTLLTKTIQETSFRNQKLYSFEEENVFADFSPLLSNHKFSVFTVYDSHFLFAKTPETLEDIIVNINNRSVLSESSSFLTAKEKMNTSAHLVWGGQLESITKDLSKTSKPKFLPNLENLNTSGYSSILMQLTHEESFSFVNGLISKDKLDRPSKEALQVKRIKLTEEIASDPTFFTNWRTRQKDIVVQDQNNFLHLIGTDGNTIWKKPLDSRQIGDVHTFDIYKNTRLQLAFTTQNKLYVIDKNGNDVAPFPLDFKDFISEGLSIFDYDNNGKYRFVVVQYDKVLMFDKEGKQVKGFDFTPQGSIKYPLKHIRIGTKDYILAEDNSGLKILSRTGKERVKAKQNISASGNPWGMYNSNFTGTNLEGHLIEITENGTVQTTELGLSDNHYMSSSANHIVTFSENKFNINGIDISLDYGLYLPPKIHEGANRTFYSIVDQQASKVYLFDEQAKLVSGFPVFGTSQIDLDLSSPKTISFVVKGNDNAVLFYKKSF